MTQLLPFFLAEAVAMLLQSFVWASSSYKAISSYYCCVDTGQWTGSTLDQHRKCYLSALELKLEAHILQCIDVIRQLKLHSYFSKDLCSKSQMQFKFLEGVGERKLKLWSTLSKKVLPGAALIYTACASLVSFMN